MGLVRGGGGVGEDKCASSARRSQGCTCKIVLLLYPFLCAKKQINLVAVEKKVQECVQGKCMEYLKMLYNGPRETLIFVKDNVNYKIFTMGLFSTPIKPHSIKPRETLSP